RPGPRAIRPEIRSDPIRSDQPRLKESAADDSAQGLRSRRIAMAHSRSLLAVAVLAGILHAMVIVRTLLPAQDGLKFIRVAQQFQVEPWSDVIRGTDVHPLYPALVALAEPAVAWLDGSGPHAWRIAAQVVAAVFSIGMLVPIYFLTESLFDRR